MKSISLMTVILPILLGISTTNLLAQTADVVLTDGQILTVDDDFSVANSIAIADGRIIAVGSSESISKHIGDNTVDIALEGKTVIPGLIDNHFHFIRGAWNYQQEARLEGVTSRDDSKNVLQAKVKAKNVGDWVTVMGGWSYDQFRDNSTPYSLSELDEIAPENPLFLMRNYSQAYANSRALEAAGLESNGSAEITGRENVNALVKQVTWRNKSSSSDVILAYMKELNRVGLTLVYDVGRPSEGSLEPLAALADSQQLPLRVYHTLRYSARDAASAEEAISLIEGGEVKPFSKDLQFGLLGLGEHIYVPVSDNPNHTGFWPLDSWGPFSKISFAAAKNGWPVHEHVMSGDTAKQYLDLVAKIQETEPELKELRWTFAHVNGMQDEDIDKAARLGVALTVHSQARMSVRASDAPRVGSIERSGALWGLGSDAGIVASYLPFDTLEWAVAGTNISGKIGWGEDQRVSREDALKAHTLSNARLLFVEDHLGSLEVGKLADLVVLDKDYMAIDEKQISEILPLMTMTNGKIVYQRE